MAAVYCVSIVQYLSLFFTSFLAGSFFPLGSEVLFLYLQKNGLHLFSLIFVAGLGNTLGGMTCYFIARYGGLPLIKKYLVKDEAMILRWKNKVEGRGEWLALFSWLPIVGELIPTALGLSSTRMLKICLLIFIGKTLRYAVLAFMASGLFFQ